MRYTLRQLMLWTAICPPMLGAVAWMLTPVVIKNTNRGAAQGQIGLLADAVSYYWLTIGSLPSDLNALVARPADGPDSGKWNGPYLEKVRVPCDPWNNPYAYQVLSASKGTFRVWSKGPDGKTPSPDDIECPEYLR